MSFSSDLHTFLILRYLDHHVLSSFSVKKKKAHTTIFDNLEEFSKMFIRILTATWSLTSISLLHDELYRMVQNRTSSYVLAREVVGAFGFSASAVS